jgi:hypothetical protein
MQKDHGRAGAVGGVPDPSAIVCNVALTGCEGKRRGTFRLEADEVIVMSFQLDLLVKGLDSLQYSQNSRETPA